METFANVQMQKKLQMQATEKPLPGLIIFPKGRQSADNLGEGAQGLPGLLALPTQKQPNACLGCLFCLPTVNQGLPGSQALPGNQGLLGNQGLPGPRNAIAKNIAHAESPGA